MSKIKKNIILVIIIIIALASVFSVAYLFSQFKKQEDPSKLLAELEVAQRNREIEIARLNEIREKSYFLKVSKAEYLKTKELIARIDIFFKNPNSDRPEIQLKTKNKVIETEINAKRLKITEILRIWDDNNTNSLETDQELIEEIRVYLLIIQEYSKQLQSIVSDLSIEDSGLTALEINSYKKIVDEAAEEIDKIIGTIKEAEIVINESIATTTVKEESAKIKEQIRIIEKIEEDINTIEDKLADKPETPEIINQTIPKETTTAEETPSINTTTFKRPRIINQDNPVTTYISNPTPFRNSGVDIDLSGQIVPLQDW